MKCPHCGKEVELTSSVKLKKPKEAKGRTIKSPKKSGTVKRSTIKKVVKTAPPKRVTEKEPSDKVKKVQPAITKPKEKGKKGKG